MENAFGGNNTTVKAGAWRAINNTEKIIGC